MIIKQVMNNCYNFVFPSTIAKILLSENSIINFLFEFENMKNMNTNDVKEQIKKFETSKETKELTEGLSKKNILLNKILSHKEYCYIPDFYKAFTITDYNDEEIEGPYLSGREIIFYNNVKQLLLVFTYFPFHNIKNINYSDVLIREIKSYVFDNFPKDVFDKYIKNVYIASEKPDINISDVMSNKILTTRFSKNSNEILRLVKINDMYQWEFVFKTEQKKEK